MSSRWQRKEKPSYLAEMLLHPYSVNSFLTSVGLGIAASIPWGSGPAFIPFVTYAAGAAIAAMFVPGSRKFQEYVDRKEATAAREKSRTHLLGELRKKADATHRLWPVYYRLLERRDSLQKVAEHSESAITQFEVDRLNDATIDFLGLWLGRMAISDRQRAMSDRDIENRLANAEAQLENAETDADRRRLVRAKADLADLLRRRQEMATRETSAEAAMMSIADTFDEVYQRVMANPNSRDEELRVAVDRMNVEEELDNVLYEDVEAVLGEPNDMER